MVKKAGFIVLFLAALVVYGVFFMERDWAAGHQLNPYQVDEIVVVQSEPNPYIAEQGFKIHNGGWIREALDTVKNLEPIRNPEKPSTASSYTFAVPGEFRFFIYRNSKDWMLVDNGKYYRAPQALMNKLSMSRDDFLQIEDVESWTDWSPFVMIDGKLHFASPSEKRYKQSMKPVFTVHQLPQQPPLDFDVQGIENHSSSYADGTPIYQIDGKYYVRLVKEPDMMSVLTTEEK